jgi:hypothetical protein
MPTTTIELTDKELAVVIACCTDSQRRMLEAIENAAENSQFVKAYEGKDLFETLDSANEKMQAAFKDMPKTSG